MRARARESKEIRVDGGRKKQEKGEVLELRGGVKKLRLERGLGWRLGLREKSEKGISGEGSARKRKGNERKGFDGWKAEIIWRVKEEFREGTTKKLSGELGGKGEKTNGKKKSFKEEKDSYGWRLQEGSGWAFIHRCLTFLRTAKRIV